MQEELMTKNKEEFEAVQTLAKVVKETCEKIIAQGGFDRTVPGIVLSNQTIDGLVDVQVMGGQYTIHNGSSVVYKEGDSVWITVPCNDVNNMFINSIRTGDMKINIPEIDLSEYAKKDDIPDVDLTGYVKYEDLTADENIYIGLENKQIQTTNIKINTYGIYGNNNNDWRQGLTDDVEVLSDLDYTADDFVKDVTCTGSVITQLTQDDNGVVNATTAPLSSLIQIVYGKSMIINSNTKKTINFTQGLYTGQHDTINNDASHYLLRVPINRYSSTPGSITVNCTLRCAKKLGYSFHFHLSSASDWEDYVVDSQTFVVNSSTIYTYDFKASDILDWMKDVGQTFEHEAGYRGTIYLQLVCDIIATSDESVYAPFDDPTLTGDIPQEGYIGASGHKSYKNRCFSISVDTINDKQIIASVNDYDSTPYDSDDARPGCDVGIEYNFTKVNPLLQLPIKINWVVATDFNKNLNDVIDYCRIETAFVNTSEWRSSHLRRTQFTSTTAASITDGCLFGAPFSYNPNGAEGYLLLTTTGQMVGKGGTQSPYYLGVYFTRSGYMLHDATCINSDTNSYLYASSSAYRAFTEKKTFSKRIIDTLSSVYNNSGDRQYAISNGNMIKNPYWTGGDFFGTPYEVEWSAEIIDGQLVMNIDHIYKITPKFVSGKSYYSSQDEEYTEVTEINTRDGYYGGRIISRETVTDASKTLQ